MALRGRRLRLAPSQTSRREDRIKDVSRGWPRSIEVTYAWAPFRDGLWERTWDVSEFPQITIRADQHELLSSLCDRALKVFAQAQEWRDPRVGGEYFVSLLAQDQAFLIDLGNPHWIQILYGVRADGSLIIDKHRKAAVTLGDLHRGIQAGYTPGSIDRIVIQYPQGLGGGPFEAANQLMEFLDSMGVLVATAAGGRWAWSRRRRPMQRWTDRQVRRTAHAWREGNIDESRDIWKWFELKEGWDAQEVANRLSIPVSTAEALLESLGYMYEERSARWSIGTTTEALENRGRWLTAEAKPRANNPPDRC